MTLKEFVIAFDGLYHNDIALIEDFFIKNNLETEALGMISKLAYKKAQKDTHTLETVKFNVSMLALNSYRDYYPKDFADLLQRASFKVAIGEDITKTDLWEKLKENVPKHTLKKNGLMWRDLYELLTKNDIYFKGEAKRQK